MRNYLIEKKTKQLMKIISKWSKKEINAFIDLLNKELERRNKK